MRAFLSETDTDSLSTTGMNPNTTNMWWHFKNCVILILKRMWVSRTFFDAYFELSLQTSGELQKFTNMFMQLLVVVFGFVSKQ